MGAKSRSISGSWATVMARAMSVVRHTRPSIIFKISVTGGPSALKSWMWKCSSLYRHLPVSSADALWGVKHIVRDKSTVQMEQSRICMFDKPSLQGHIDNRG